MATQTNNHNAGTASVSTLTLSNYRFPTHRLKSRQSDPSRTPLVLVACGSFSPITYLHLRMFEMAADFCRFNTQFEVMGGYLSPVSDAYKKAGLANSTHRYVHSSSG
jgi:nicotinamide mononucleotide adenylyltransferase